MDLRGNVRGRSALEVSDPRPWPPRLQPVELRPRPLLPPARRAAGRPARAVVGSAVPRARPRAGADRRRRLPHPPATAPAGDRGRVLAGVRGGDRRARRERAHDDGGLARRADRGQAVLVAARDLAGDPRLPLLHDHRPEDDPRELAGRRAYAVGVGLLATRPDSAADDRVRDQGRDPRVARARLRRQRARRARRRRCGCRPAHATRRRVPEPLAARAAGARRRARVRRARRRRRNPGAPGPARRAAATACRPASRDRGQRRRTTSPPSTRRRPQTIARDVLADLRTESAALRRKDRSSRRPPPAGRGSRRCGPDRGLRRRGRRSAQYDVERIVLSLQRGTYQGPPTVVADLQGTLVASTYGQGPTFVEPREPQPLPADPRARARERPVPDRPLRGRPRGDAAGRRGSRAARSEARRS